MSLVVLAKPAETQQAWRAWASTNLVNLHDHPFGAMVASAFLTDGDTWVWITLAFVGLVAAGRALGSARTALLAVTAHVLGTLVSEGILAYRIMSGAAAPEARHLLDIGPSYIVVCALVAAIGYGTWPGRLLSAVGFALLAPYLFDGLLDLNIWAIGHVCSIIIGLIMGYALWASRRRSGARSVTS